MNNKFIDSNNEIIKTNKPKVLIIHNMVSPYRLPLFDSLSKSYDVNVIFCKDISKDRVWKYDLSKYKFRYKILNGKQIGPLIINFGIIAPLIFNKYDIVVCNNDPDVAHAALTALIISKIKGADFLNWSQVTDDEIYYLKSYVNSDKDHHRLTLSIIKKIVKNYRKIFIKFSDGFFTIGSRATEYLIEKEVSENKISSSINIMPLELLPKPKTKVKRDGKTILYIGYLNKRKGVDKLIKVFKDISDKNVRLIIAGSGPMGKSLRNLAQKDSRIKFYDYVEGLEKANLYASADIFVLPTLNDVWGLTINEAIHYGLVVICSDAAGAIEIIDSKTGMVIPANDEIALSKAILSLTSNPKKIRLISEHNFRQHKVTDIDIMVDSLMNAIKKVSGHYE